MSTIFFIGITGKCGHRNPFLLYKQGRILFRWRFFRDLAAALLVFCTLFQPFCGNAELVREDDPPVVINRTVNEKAFSDFQFPENAKLLEVWFPNIRDADAALLRYDDTVWMIDCGEDKAAFRATVLLSELGIRHIQRLFNTHPHHDHLAGLWMVDNTAKVEELLVCFPRDATPTMETAMESAAYRHIPVTEYGDESVFAMGDGKVTLTVWMKAGPDRSMNDQSAQMMLRYGERTMLFTADAERPGQRDLLAAVGPQALRADILKYPHHGKLALDDDFLAAVRPELAVITNYRRSGESFSYLSDKHVDAVYTNRQKKFVRLVTDGKQWICEFVPIAREQ